MYLAVSPYAISTILVKEEGAAQMLIYYTSRALQGTEARYPRMEMLVFALVIAARRLWSYFQAHPIKFLIENPLRKILQNPKNSRRLVNWSIKLNEFGIDYLPRGALKGQALANFITEFTSFPQEVASTLVGKPCQILVDSTSCSANGRIGIHIDNNAGREYHYMAKLMFKTTNNEIEYEALIARFSIIETLGATEVEVKANS